MKHVVVGTAGHIDHGKTELVKALTGINTDRLKEEQERGITIDIGFAPLPLAPADGGEPIMVGFVDVPGHEKFVKNMLAGIWGIDLVLLVVAADESIRPQTREHFEICSLLKVKRGLVVLTKMDLVDQDLLDLVTLEVRDFTRGSFLDGAPIIPVSSRTREGLEQLKNEISKAARDVEPGRPSTLLRLPVDRSFSVRGFGTVVTGTLVSGSIVEGDEVAVYPESQTCRVRGIQVHGASTKEAHAGQRTAVNLQGVDAAAVQRGNVIGRPGQMRPSSLLDVKITLLAGAPAPLVDLARVRFHQGTSELLARVKLLGATKLDPGQEAFAQIRLESSVMSLPGDRFVIRRYSPTATIGGGVLLDAFPAKHKGAAAPALLDRLARLDRADALETLRVYLEGATVGITAAQLAVRAGLARREVEALLTRDVSKGDVVCAGEGAAAIFMDHHAAEEIEKQVTASLEAYHRANPLRPGMPLEELREQALNGVGPDLSRFVVERLAARGVVKTLKETISLSTHSITLSPEDERTMERIEAAYRRSGLNPPELEDVVRLEGLDGRRASRVIHLLLASGRLTKIRDGTVFHAEAIESLKNKLWELRPGQKVIDISSFKELTGTSRKTAIPLLEHLDSVKVTRRVGSDREILPPPGG
jgi:selenocysteine-specific elongation factor